MGHIKGITNMGIARNPDYIEPWLRSIGTLMLNFGTIELLSYKYLDTLESSEEDFLKNTNKFLSHRITRIFELVEKQNTPQKLEILELWGKVKELAKWRNRIAHNPVVPSWKPESDCENSPPDLLGVPDMKQIKEPSRTTDSISLKGLGKLNDEVVSVASKLNELINTIQNA